MRVLLVLFILAGAAGAWWHFRPADAPPPVDRDRVVRVERRDLLKAVIASGRVEPNARVAVMSRASGIVKELFVDEGDEVKQGQIIAELDREQLVAQHNENLGNYAAAKARLDAAKARLDEAQVKLVDPELDHATRIAARLHELFDAGTATRTEVDDADLRVANVDFRIRQIRASIPVLAAGVSQAEADLDSANAAKARSEQALREATIRSPIDGIVLVRSKEVGDGVSSILTAGGNATELMTLGDVSSMYVTARVDEVDVGKISVDMRAVVSVDAYRDHTFEGHVVRIAPAGTVDNNGVVTFEVKVALSDPERLLRVDMTATTRLVLEERTHALALPHKALARAGGGWRVSRVDSFEPPRLEPVDVKIGVSDGLITEILDGVSEGDRILLPSEIEAPSR